MKNIIITSGGTSERIDSVRKITNSSSGKLGSIIANTLINGYSSEIKKIYYICDKKAVLPIKNDKIEIIIISDVDSLYQEISKLLTQRNIDIFIHAMAVSDYAVDLVTNTNRINTFIRNTALDSFDINDILYNCKLDLSSKISSYSEDLIIKLKPTIKVISKIKELSPTTTLVGFKLLSGVTDEKLIEVANNLLIKNKCDFVVANKIDDIDKNKHKAFIINKNSQIQSANTKDEIASLLAKELYTKK